MIAYIQNYQKLIFFPSKPSCKKLKKSKRIISYNNILVKKVYKIRKIYFSLHNPLEKK